MSGKIYLETFEKCAGSVHVGKTERSKITSQKVSIYNFSSLKRC